MLEFFENSKQPKNQNEKRPKSIREIIEQTSGENISEFQNLIKKEEELRKKGKHEEADKVEKELIKTIKNIYYKLNSEKENEISQIKGLLAELNILEHINQNEEAEKIRDELRQKLNDLRNRKQN